MNKNLCQHLFDLSGWRETEHYWYQDWLRQDRWAIGSIGYADETTIPAYDLGYLLRKLPQNTWIGYTDTSGNRDSALAKTWAWNTEGSDVILLAEEKSETPEDALCCLALSLFQQGILRRNDDNSP